MTIKHLGGVFGRNPTFNDVTIEGTLTFDGAVDITTDLTIDGVLTANGLVIDTDTLVVDATNNRVGIGTTSPDGKLDVAGIQNTTKFTLPHLALTATSLTDNTGFTGISYASSSLTNYGWTVGALRGSSGSNASFVFTQHNDSAAGDEKMRLDGSGNVGIGTSSPATSLHVLNTSDTQIRLSQSGEGSYDLGVIDGDKFAINRDGLTNEFVMSNGNVGIGTSSPGVLLDVSGATPTIRAIGTSASNPSLTLSSAGITAWSQTVSGSDSSLSFNRDGSEAMRLDSSGKLLVGKTTSLLAGSGAVLSDSGNNFTRDGASPVNLNRLTSDGALATFYKDGNSRGNIGIAFGDNLYISGDSSHSGIAFGTNEIYPSTVAGAGLDDDLNLGSSTARFKDIYATNGTIQTSDRNEKQDIEELSDAEQRVAVACKGLLRKFRWKSSVADKGDEARIHFGIIAQDLQAAFEAEGLDAGRYGMFINSTWTDEETGEERSRMGVRYNQLLAFIIAAI